MAAVTPAFVLVSRATSCLAVVVVLAQSEGSGSTTLDDPVLEGNIYFIDEFAHGINI